MKIETNILIVGLGLLGGSYAQALTKKQYLVNAIDNDHKAIDYALENNFIQKGSSEVDKQLIEEADLIIFGLYPTTLVKWIKENGHLITPNTIVTDVSGIKKAILQEINSSLPEGVEFISAHPMAGREYSGITYSDHNIFKGANYLVVPTEENSQHAISVCKQLGRILGFKTISVITPDKHDKMIAFLSQLTHVIAISLMNSIDQPNMEDYTGDSFRDLTRIASLNEEMWTELFLLNKEDLLTQISNFKTQLIRMEDYLTKDNAELIKEMMITSTRRRKRFDKIESEN